MDPNENLAEQLRRAAYILAEVERGDRVDPDDAVRLAELVQALDGWLTKGGALPEAWARGRALSQPVQTSNWPPT